MYLKRPPVKISRLLQLLLVFCFVFYVNTSDTTKALNSQNNHKSSSLNSQHYKFTDNSYNAKDNNNINNNNNNNNDNVSNKSNGNDNNSNNSNGGDNSENSSTDTTEQDSTATRNKPPHIIFILADDLVSFVVFIFKKCYAYVAAIQKKKKSAGNCSYFRQKIKRKSGMLA